MCKRPARSAPQTRASWRGTCSPTSSGRSSWPPPSGSVARSWPKPPSRSWAGGRALADSPGRGPARPRPRAGGPRAGLRAARVAAAGLLTAEPAEIALATNTSHGLNLAARALPLQRGDVVLVSDREFPANVYPWMLLKKQGVEVELAPCAPEGWPDEAFLVERLHDPRVRVLAVSFVQFPNGYRAALARLGVACRAHGTVLVVDGIQGVGNSVLDVRETPVDILACGGQKWLLAPWGSGFVYVRRELISVLEPAVAGWMAFEGTDDFSRLTEYNPTFRSDARRFELATLP